MVHLIIFLVALVPVLTIGALLIELLLASAPRRGKRPDVSNASGSAETDIAATITEAAEKVGLRSALVVGRVVCTNGRAEPVKTSTEKEPALRH